GKRATRLLAGAGSQPGPLGARGNLSQYVFDALNRQTVTVDALGNRTTSLLDKAGNVTGVQDPLSHLSQFLFDADNRQTVTIDARSEERRVGHDGTCNQTAALH